MVRCRHRCINAGNTLQGYPGVSEVDAITDQNEVLRGNLVGAGWCADVWVIAELQNQHRPQRV